MCTFVEIRLYKYKVFFSQPCRQCMFRAVGSRTITAETRLRLQVSPCRICGEEISPETNLSSEYLNVPCQ
jgi:hypothetical protein